jgi:hypothetical protein
LNFAVTAALAVFQNKIAPCSLQNSTFLQIRPPYRFPGVFESQKIVAKGVSFARSFATPGKGVLFQFKNSLEHYLLTRFSVPLLPNTDFFDRMTEGNATFNLFQESSDLIAKGFKAQTIAVTDLETRVVSYTQALTFAGKAGEEASEKTALALSKTFEEALKAQQAANEFDLAWEKIQRTSASPFSRSRLTLILPPYRQGRNRSNLSKPP